MGKGKNLLFLGGLVIWGLAVAALLVYLFFPYQKVMKIALQNVVGGGRSSVSMEGVKTRMLGVRAKKLFLKPDANGSQMVPFELSDVDISWSPLSLLKGSLSLDSRATLYNGSIHSAVHGITFPGPSSPSIFLALKGVDMAKCPQGVFPWFRGVTGTLDGIIRKDVPLATPDRQSGAFRFTLKNGEVRDLQVRNLPRLVIPYREIIIEGKINGPRVEVRKIDLTSDVVRLHGSGSIESGDVDQNINIDLSYEALSSVLPLKGKGIISIRGNQAAPLVSISNTTAAKQGSNEKS